MLVIRSGYLGTKVTGWQSNFNAIADLKDLPLSPPYDTWLTDANHAGYYKVTLTVDVQCSGVDDEYVGYFYLEQPPSAPLISLLVSDTLLQFDTAGNPIINTSTDCNSKNATLMCSAPQNGPRWIAGIGTFGQFNIEQYSRLIERVDCSNGLNPAFVYEDANPILVNANQTIVNDDLNTISINGSQGFFNDPNKVGNCYKLTVTVFNACGSASDFSFFELDNRLYRLKPQTDEGSTLEEHYSERVNFYPNPVKNQLTFEIENQEDIVFGAVIYDLSGKKIQNLHQNKRFAKGNHTTTINLNRLSKGIYFLEYSINNIIKREKIVKH